MISLTTPGSVSLASVSIQVTHDELPGGAYDISTRSEP
jgi:hypothetical protein